METIQDFRERLRSYLANGSVNQSALAKATGVPQYVISRFLSGRDLRGRHLMPLQAAISEHVSPPPLSSVSSESIGGGE